MAIFNKCHALFLGFLVFAIIGTAGYSVNQGGLFSTPVHIHYDKESLAFP